MADVKISGLPASTIPLAGTEVLPIVQGGTTKQVSVANLTAGRAVNASTLTASSLTAGRVPFAGTAGLLSDSTNLFWDNTNARLGIGNTTPTQKLDVFGGLNLDAAATLPASTGSTFIFSNESPNKRVYIGDGTGYAFNFSKRTGSTTTDLVTVADSGAVSSINTFTSTNDAGFTLGSVAGYTKSFTRTQSSPFDQLNVISRGGSGGWQGAVNIQVSYNNGTPYTALTAQDNGAGTAADVTVSTGNLVIGTSGKGIDFSATAGTGTSELLADYEEGTWTPTAVSNLTLASVYTSRYTKIGRMVYCETHIGVTAISGTNFTVGGLPFANGKADRVATVTGVIGTPALQGGWVDTSATTFLCFVSAIYAGPEIDLYLACYYST